jgi:DNA-directed RNA polymerase subunit RPC12/RpoP
MLSEEEIDHEYTEEITCPHCGYAYHDSWEYGSHSEHHEYDNMSDEMECEQCEKEFTWSRNVEVTYSSQPKKTDDAS